MDDFSQIIAELKDLEEVWLEAISSEKPPPALLMMRTRIILTKSARALQLLVSQKKFIKKLPDGVIKFPG